MPIVASPGDRCSVPVAPKTAIWPIPSRKLTLIHTWQQPSWERTSPCPRAEEVRSSHLNSAILKSYSTSLLMAWNLHKSLLSTVKNWNRQKWAARLPAKPRAIQVVPGNSAHIRHGSSCAASSMIWRATSHDMRWVKNGTKPLELALSAVPFAQSASAFMNQVQNEASSTAALGNQGIGGPSMRDAAAIAAPPPHPSPTEELLQPA
mmetsp:Transcript_95961/g.277118  ORF Transcript_95961/g.277118 Transcript_95961/m.277118 type:complete len:206 (-) Transcript_95961:288-905(-)